MARAMLEEQREIFALVQIKSLFLQLPERAAYQDFWPFQALSRHSQSHSVLRSITAWKYLEFSVTFDP